MAKNTDTRFELYYWPLIPGRGEFPRLVLEEAGADYVDVGRLSRDEGGGVEAIVAMLDGADDAQLPYAPPILRDGELVLAQSAAICHYLGLQLGLVPEDETSRWAALQIQLTVADLVDETHDTHHPIAVSLYYEDQQAESAKRASAFLESRMPKFLGYFELVLERAGGAWMLGDAFSYVDLSVFHVLEGLAYAFPNAFAAFDRRIPRLLELRGRVTERPRVAGYLASTRRLPFNEHGIFRRYPELDRP